MIVRPVAHPAVDFGGQDDFVASPAAGRQPPADYLFGFGFVRLAAVSVGGVEEMDPQFQRLIHDGMAVGFCGLRAEVHSAQTKRAYL